MFGCARVGLWFLAFILLTGCGKGGPNQQAAPAKKKKSAVKAKLQIEPAVPPANLPEVSEEEMARMDGGHREMVEWLRKIALDSKNPYFGDRAARRLRALIKLLPTNPQKPEVLSTLYTGLAELELQLGNESESIKYFKLAIDVAKKRTDVSQQERNRLVFRLGVAYMRVAETQNCCQRYNADSCIVPFRKAALHSNQNGSRLAAASFQQVLEETEVTSELHLQALWLFNLAYMTLGEFPDKVPAKYRLPGNIFQAKNSFPVFRNAAAEAGFSRFTCAGGAIADDFNGDGLIDLVVSCWDPAEQIRFYLNVGDGTFEDQTAQAGLTGIVGGLNLLQTDFNNDGFIDVYVLRGAWLGESGQHPNSLLRNNGDGTFTDVTIQAGLADKPMPTQTATWADFNNDGNIDLYVGIEGPPCQFYVNQGDGTFTEQAQSALVTNIGLCKGVTSGDFDGDGRVDLYVSNSGAPNRLYRNLGGLKFVDVATRCKVRDPIISFPCWFWDFDNDGHLDIYVADYSPKTNHLASFVLGMKQGLPLDKLYKGDGKGGFKDVAQQVGLNSPTAPMGSNFGDLDNDGWLDFYLGTGNTDYADLMPNMMFHSQGGKRFEDVTVPGRFGHLQKGHAITFADFDGDGDQDIFQQLGGALRGDKFYDALYLNPGFKNNFLKIRLIGVQQNRFAVGSRICLVLKNGKNVRKIYRHVNSGGSFGANSFTQHIGIGKHKQIDRIEIQWAGKTTAQVIRNIPANSSITICEGDNKVVHSPKY